jgi:hypothetical protein
VTPPPTEAARPADLRRALLAHLGGDFEAAEALYRRTLAAPQLAPIAHRHLIRLLEAQHRWDEALAECRTALAREPASPDLKIQLALLLLGLGRYSEAWPLYEARSELPSGSVRPTTLPYPEWDGAPIRSLTVWDEQGFGDTIQHARFIPLLIARGIEVTLVVRPELTALLSGLGATVIPARGRLRIPIVDAWAMMDSLPGRLGVTLESLEGGPYLAAPADRRAKWARAFGPSVRIGVVSKGKAIHPNDAQRSLPPEAAGFLQALPAAISLLPEESGLPLADFADTAAIIERLDLVIAVDTATAHLAGALGKPCWVLLPALGADWRWLHDRTDSPWYPAHRLYRQPSPGDWASVLRAVARDIPIFFGQAG